MTQPRRRIVATTVIATAVLAAAAGWWLLRQPADRSGAPEAAGQVVQVVRSGDIEIVLRSATGTLRTGRSTFTIAFRSSAGVPLPVRNVRATANMSMPGMVMTGNLRLSPGTSPGEYTATADFGMAGAWQVRIEWDGPDGPGAASFEGVVQ